MKKIGMILSNKKANPFEIITRKNVEKAFNSWNGKNETQKL